LLGYNDFAPVALADEHLDALAFLDETFGPGAPMSEQITHLLRVVI